MVKNAANIISAVRIPLSLALLFFPTMDTAFVIVYAVAFATDIADGFVARATDSCTEFGSRLDSVCDLVFTAVVFVKIIQWVELPLAMWVWIAAVAALRLYMVFYTYRREGKFSIPHSVPNKITGLLVFLTVFIYRYAGVPGVAAVCAFATFASLYDAAMATRSSPDADARP